MENTPQTRTLNDALNTMGKTARRIFAGAVGLLVLAGVTGLIGMQFPFQLEGNVFIALFAVIVGAGTLWVSRTDNRRFRQGQIAKATSNWLADIATVALAVFGASFVTAMAGFSAPAVLAFGFGGAVAFLAFVRIWKGVV